MVTDQFEAMTSDQLRLLLAAVQGMVAAIQEKLSERERGQTWDDDEEKWDKAFACPESVEDMKKVTARIDASIRAGTSIEYIPGMSLDELLGLTASICAN